jgi:hypothetical protein
MYSGSVSLPNSTKTAQFQRQKPCFLNLPLEIRLEIYKYLANKLNHDVRKPKRQESCVNITRVDIGRKQPWPFYISNRKQHASEPVMCTVRATNRQIYQETLEFITYPRLEVRVDVDPKLKSISSPEVIKILSDPFLREMAVEVTFQFKPEVVPRWNWRYAKDQLGQHCSSLVSKALKTPLSRWRGSVDKSPFTEIIGILESYNTLDTVYIKTDFGDLLELWKDPVGDLAAFLPLLGGRIGIDVLMGSPRVREGPTYDARQRMIEILTKGDGEVLLQAFNVSPSTFPPRDVRLYSVELRAFVQRAHGCI